MVKWCVEQYTHIHAVIHRLQHYSKSKCRHSKHARKTTQMSTEHYKQQLTGGACSCSGSPIGSPDPPEPSPLPLPPNCKGYSDVSPLVLVVVVLVSRARLRPLLGGGGGLTSIPLVRNLCGKELREKEHIKKHIKRDVYGY
jgi:hypothetical protein